MVGAGELAVVDVPEPELTYIRVSHQTRLQFGQTEVVIESPFELRVAGVRHALDPGERAGLGPLLAVYPDVLGTAAVDSDGTLRLLFASGSSLVVPPDDHYEAWQIEGPGTRLVLCTPGGTELAVWT